MKHRISLFFLLGLSISTWAQFAPAAGLPGSTAVPAESPFFTHWASSCMVERGPVDIAQPDLGLATVGLPEFALGPATETEVVSLGDGGQATLEFDPAIIDHLGADFAVFENAFLPTFLELAFVEVSSDGEYFQRFPAISLTPTDQQVDAFGVVEATQINQLAGKYEQGYGVPFDLANLPPDPLVDRQNIRYVRIVDVVGSISPEFGSLDSEGNLINEPYPTPFASGGFDLNAVGVLAPNTLSSTESSSSDLAVYPNPLSPGFSEVFWNQPFTGRIELVNQVGQTVYSSACWKCEKITLNAPPSGIYWLIFEADESGFRHQISLIISD